MTVDTIKIEVVFALPDDQALVSVDVDAGATVADVITRSGIREDFPEENIDALQVGLWGRVVDRDCRVKDGDRVEIYRPLLRDPRDARRELAQSGLTMRGAAKK